jgi:hypothetical protein
MCRENMGRVLHEITSENYVAIRIGCVVRASHKRYKRVVDALQTCRMMSRLISLCYTRARSIRRVFKSAMAARFSINRLNAAGIAGARGFALIVLMSFIALISAFVLASGISQSMAEVRLAKQDRDNEYLQKAKSALIALAVKQAIGTNADTVSGTYQADQPGALPCPDTNNDGYAEQSCSSAANQVGRLPWKTLVLEDLRDSEEERFWYVLSSNFVKSASNIINPDTRGQLVVQDATGTTLLSNVAAAVIAPGAPVRSDNAACPAIAAGSLQDRSAANSNMAASYLEKTNSGTTGVLVTSTVASECLNDKVMEILDSEVFAAIEPVVAARIERDVVPYMTAYATAWSAYPFPVTFSPGPGTSASRASSQYFGASSESAGLLPVASTLTYSWAAGSPAVAVTSGTAVVSSSSCATSASPAGWQCTVTFAAVLTGTNILNFTQTLNNPVIRIVATIANAGSVFATKKTTADVSSLPFLTSQSLSYSPLSNSSTTTVTYTGTLTASCVRLVIAGGCANQTVTVTIPDPGFSNLTSASNTTLNCSGTNCGSGWFIANQWYRQTYYALAPGYRPGGGYSCTAGSNCLSVSNLRSSYAASNDKQAILILAGRSLAARNASSSAVSDYLEGLNAKTAVTDSPGAYGFEHGVGTPTSSCLRNTALGVACSTPYLINDRVVVVAP